MKKFLIIFGVAVAMSALWSQSARAAVIIVTGDISQNTTWTQDNQYVLSGAVFVRGPATLTIEAGTTVFGESATNGTLVIDRGAKIDAVGTAKKPIVFTSDQPRGQRVRGDWGGLILNGFARLNVPGGESEGEGDTGTYGGQDDEDSSGRVIYVRVEFAGTEFSPDNELNGIAFQGVGRGTEVHHVQVHMNKDDGFEFFGGTVNLKYALTTYIGDDNFDATDGWRGYGQFWIAQQRADDADNGFEWDNNAENNRLTPTTLGTVYNVTLVGDPTNSFGGESDLGMLLREGTAGRIANAIVIGFKEWGIVITNTKTHKNARRGKLLITNSIFWNNGSALSRFAGNWSDNANDKPRPATTTAQWMGSWDANTAQDPMLKRPFKLNEGPAGRRPIFRPRKNSPAVDGTVPVAIPPKTPNSFFDRDVNFIGALGPKSRDDWTKGWTIYDGS